MDSVYTYKQIYTRTFKKNKKYIEENKICFIIVFFEIGSQVYVFLIAYNLDNILCKSCNIRCYRKFIRDIAAILFVISHAISSHINNRFA